MAEDAVFNQESDIFDAIDPGDIFRGLDEDPFFTMDFDFFQDPWIPESASLPQVTQGPDPASLALPDPLMVESGSLKIAPSFISSGERFQLDEVDVGHEDGTAEFFSEVLVDGSDKVDIVPESPKAYEGEDKNDKEVRISFVAGDEEDDPVSKKLKKKMRNRESAMKSRERKKAYTKDLEMKSKYLESECCRLDHLLQCCLTENTVLRESLQFQKNRLCGASMAKQESAVLFVESLLLVSLFWLMGILCLFLFPNLQCPNPKIVSREGRRDLTPQILEVKKSPKFVEFKSPTGEKSRRRYRGTKARMKQLFLFLLHAFVGLVLLDFWLASYVGLDSGLVLDGELCTGPATAPAVDRYDVGHYRRIAINVTSYVAMVMEMLKNSIP